MASLKELKELLSNCEAGEDTDLEGMVQSLALIPEIERDDLQYTPSRPSCKDFQDYLNVLGPNMNVYPLYLHYMVKTDGYGASFVVSPTKMMRKIISGFEDNEVLGPYGDGRTPRKILRLPLTLDYYTYFSGKKDSMRLFLAFFVSYLLAFEDGIQMFRKPRPANKFTGFSLNCPYAEVIDLKMLYVLRQELMDFLVSINFKENQMDSVKIETKNIILESKCKEPLEVIVCNKIRLLEYCVYCSREVLSSPFVRPVYEEEEEIKKGGTIQKEKRKVKWSFSSLTYECEVVHKDKNVAGLYFNVLISSLMKKDGHNHLLGEEKKDIILTKDLKLSMEYGEQYVGKKIYVNQLELLRGILEDNLISKDDSLSMARGMGMYLIDVPYGLIESFPFFVRNRKKIYIRWKSFCAWYHLGLLDHLFEEKNDMRFGYVIVSNVQTFLWDKLTEKEFKHLNWERLRKWEEEFWLWKTNCEAGEDTNLEGTVQSLALIPEIERDDQYIPSCSSYLGY